LSNEIAEKRPDGRDVSTLLYEYSFDTTEGGMKKHIKWNEFKPMYRGRPKDDAAELNAAGIRRWSFMIRSFFDQQHGEFSMSIRSVCTYQEKDKAIAAARESDVLDVKKEDGVKEESKRWCSVQ
jgi:hypothetical protein